VAAKITLMDGAAEFQLGYVGGRRKSEVGSQKKKTAINIINSM
jgi:hypothetical protein